MYYSTIIGCVCRRRTPRLHHPLLSSACCHPVVSRVGFSPHPPAPLYASHNSARFNGHSPFPPFSYSHTPTLHSVWVMVMVVVRFGLWFGFGYLRFELWLREARRKSRPLGRRAGFPFARRNEREKKPLASRARAREVHSLSQTAVGGGPTGFPLASPNARPPLPPPRAAFRETRPKLWLYNR